MKIGRTKLTMLALSIVIVPGIRAKKDNLKGQSHRVPSNAEVLRVLERVDKGGGAALSIERGREMFLHSCTQCHNAERSTSKSKTYNAWLITVRRMAEKSGSEIPQNQIEPIAAYLASLGFETPDDPHLGHIDVPAVVDSSDSAVTLNGTVSAIWRESDAILENQGFFADAWAGLEWRPSNRPLSITMTACTSCHESAGGGMTFELAEASLAVDLFHIAAGQGAEGSRVDLTATAKAGRFIVPFGAFADTVHPGSFRMLTSPLPFNMGRRVGSEEFLPPVLPMPYSDEGVSLRMETSLPAELRASFDVYAVNGLQTDFYSSRSYRDNNSEMAVGGRATLGNRWFKVGGSYGSGDMQPTGAPAQTYHLLGGDITLRYQDRLRASYEFAQREEETLPSQESRVEGHVGEVEGRIWNRPQIGMLVRYDTLDRSGLLGDATTERISWGPVLTLPGGSVLILNHEHWMFETPVDFVEDIWGFRWFVVF